MNVLLIENTYMHRIGYSECTSKSKLYMCNHHMTKIAEIFT